MRNKSTGAGRTKREGAKLQARRAEVFRRWKGGETIRQIAATLTPKMSPSVVSVDIQLALKEWRAENRGAISEAAEREWQLLNWAELELQQSWEDSKDPKKRDLVGDPRFVDSIVKVSEQRRKLLGVDKPTKIEAQTTVDVNVSTTFKSLEQMKAETLKKRQSLTSRREESGQ